MFGRFKKTALKKTPFKKKKKEVNREELDKMTNLFLSIWRKRPPYCTVCGAWLGSEPRSYMFDHILEKEKYPELKYEEKNIDLTCLSCHDCKTRGIYTDTHIRRIKEVKQTFNIL